MALLRAREAKAKSAVVEILTTEGVTGILRLELTLNTRR